MQLTALRDQVVTRLPGQDPVHARDARRRARVLLTAWGLGEQAGLGELVAGELVANAVTHGAAPVWMALAAQDGMLRVEVHDGGPGRPARKHPGDSDESGRGLQLLDALIELHGGERGVISDPAGPGKTVYVALDLKTTGTGLQ
jgi:two-component sensor histidine kinase